MMKRKEVSDTHDDFSDFSLSSPATKIRRLDAELPPIIEEVEEPDIINQQLEGLNKNEGIIQNNNSIRIEELPAVENPVRDLVLFNPLAAQSPLSDFGVSVDSRFLSGFKGQYPWLNHSSSFSLPQEYLQNAEDKAENQCQAVVPWMPSQSHQQLAQQVLEVPPQSETAEFMEADSVEDSSTMEVEDYSVLDTRNGSASHVSGGASQEYYSSLHQQQQHCLMPQHPENFATPITWWN